MKPKTYFFLFGVSVLLGGSNIPSDYLFEVSFDLDFTHKALIPQKLPYADISIADKGKLDAVHQQKTISYKVKPDYGLDMHITYALRDDELEWMRLPYRLVSDGTHRSSYDQKGKLIACRELHPHERQQYEERRKRTRDYGLGLRFAQFPYPDKESYSVLAEQGVQVAEAGVGLLSLRYPDGISKYYNLRDSSISVHYQNEEEQQQVHQKVTYRYFTGQGFLPAVKETRTRRPDGIVLVDKEVYSNYHFTGALPKPKNQGLAMELFPNPVQDWLNIQLQHEKDMILSVELYDMSGKRILEVAGSGQNHQNLSLKNLKSGSYMLRLKSRLNTQTSLLFKH